MIYDPDEQDRMRELLDEHPATDRKPINRDRARAIIAPEPDPRSPNNDIVKRCRRLDWHLPHQWLRDIGEATVHYFNCPGVPHDHDARCCTVHHTHTSPHKGCVLR